MKYLTKFQNISEYNEGSKNFPEINVSYLKEEDIVKYHDENIPKFYGIEWDTEIANPECTRIGDMNLHKTLPIQSALKGCLVNGNVLNYYLNQNDWSKKESGEASVLDGTDGDVSVQTPLFYGKSEEDGTKRRVKISTMKLGDDWVEIPAMYIRAYRATINKNGNKAVSVVNMS